MPTYDYECDACGYTFDEMQSMKDEPLKKCPKCKKAKLRRLFGTGAALLFKGEGFYITDYRSEGYKAAAKADSEKSGGGEKSVSGDGAKSAGNADGGSSKKADKASSKSEAGTKK